MKKSLKSNRELQLRRQGSKKRAEKRRAGAKKNRKRLYSSTQYLGLSEYDSLRIGRSKFLAGFYKEVKYDQPQLVVKIEEQFGIEHDFQNYIGISSKFIDSRSQWIEFDINGCTRLWPSSITLLCSFKQWTELTANVNHIPMLSSTDSSSDGVNSYLSHSGFYDYVRRSHAGANADIYSDEEIVKIKRENNKSEIDEREEAICGVLKKYSTLSEDQIEDFDCNVLIEAFNNVTEHGNSKRDNGWWTLTQYHKKTGIISLCLADNGVGIKNSLLTGPQKDQIMKKINSDDDGAYSGDSDHPFWFYSIIRFSRRDKLIVSL